MLIIGFMKNYREVFQKLTYLNMLIDQYEEGLRLVRDGSEDARKFKEEIANLKETYVVYSDLSEKMRMLIEGLDGLEYKIAKGYYVDSLTLKEIADQLGHNYGYVRRIHSELINKERAFDNQFRKLVNH